MPDRRTVILGGCLGLFGAAAGAVRLRPGTDIGFDPTSVLPQQVDGWRAVAPQEVILPSPDLLSDRVYDELAIKAFVHPEQPPITLVMAYGARQDYTFQLHRPEICYTASGFDILEVQERDLPIAAHPLPGNIMLAERGSRREAVLYWARISDVFAQSLWGQRLAVARGIGHWRVDEGVLLRLSMPAEDLASSVPTLAAFARRMVELSGARGRQVFFGQP
ncbi:exosortase C-terminal domain/associated protein EpsI [Aurantiacibacter suaedae]|uniref:exosortase C-terminal domain/associated protein EpsI n=1 Tax=Aurantiacibacter suaedae TaxID=2545755 RepID=UPI0010F4A7D1|nr:exosortase C-terminal domain/associated protein EpsI [Aurantiacibacter suaedae]